MAQKIQAEPGKDHIRLHVGGLSSDVTEKDLLDRFSSFGKVQSIEVIKGYDCACRGFAYINFDISADVNKCISILDRTKWRGNVLTIQKANSDYLKRREAELKARQQREIDAETKRKELLATLEENAAAKDKAGLWVVNRHGSVLPVLRVANNSGKVVKINPNKSNNVKRLAADSSGEEEDMFDGDDDGEAPKKFNEDIEIIDEDQMEIDEEITKANDAVYPFSDDEDDRNYESRDEGDDVPVVPANIQIEKKSALSILEQMFPEDKAFIHQKDAKMEKTRVVALKEVAPGGTGFKEAQKKIDAKKGVVEKSVPIPAQQEKKQTAVVKPVEPVKETQNKTTDKKAVVEKSVPVAAQQEKKQTAVIKPVEPTPSPQEKKQTAVVKPVEPVKQVKEVKVGKEVEKKVVIEPIKEVKVAEKKPDQAAPVVNPKKRSREESSSSSNEEDSDSDSSSMTSSASSSTEFFENIKRRKIMESLQPEKEVKEGKIVKKVEKKVVVEPIKEIKASKEAEKKPDQAAPVVNPKKRSREESSSSSSDEEDGDSDSDSSSMTSSASSSTEFFENIKRRKLMEQKLKDEQQPQEKRKNKPDIVVKPVEVVKTPVQVVNVLKEQEKKKDPKKVEKPAVATEKGQEKGQDKPGLFPQNPIDEGNGQSWVDIMTQYETERLKPVTILAPKAVWKLFPDRDDVPSESGATTSATNGVDAMEIQTTDGKPAEETVDIGVASKDYKPFFPFIGAGEKLIGDSLVRTKTLEEIEDEWRREKVFLTQDYKKKRSIAVKKRRKLEKKER